MLLRALFMFWKSSGMEIVQTLWAITPVVNHWLWIFFLRFSQDFPCRRLWLLPPVHFLWTSEKSPASPPPQYTFSQLDTTACFSGWANLSSYLIMCSSPQQTWWPWLNSFELVCVILVPKDQKETQYSSKQETEWDNHFPQPAGYALADTVALLPQGHTVDFWPVWHPPRSFSAKLLPHFSSQLLHSPGVTPLQMQGFWFLRFPFLQLVISPWTAAKSPAHSVLPSVWHHPLRCLPSHRLKPWWSCWTLSTPGWSWGMVITTDLQSGHSLTSSLSTHFQAQQTSQIFSHLVFHISQAWLQLCYSCLWTLMLLCCGGSSHKKFKIRGRRAGLFPSLRCVTSGTSPKPESRCYMLFK